MRGFRLESLGILVAQSSRPRPWRHKSALKDLSRRLTERWAENQSQYHDRDATNEKDWEILKEWFEKRVFRRIGEEGQWVGWEEELGVSHEEETGGLAHASFFNRTVVTDIDFFSRRAFILLFIFPICYVFLDPPHLPFISTCWLGNGY